MKVAKGSKIVSLGRIIIGKRGNDKWPGSLGRHLRFERTNIMTLIERVLHEVAPVAAEATPVEVIIGAYWTLTTISHRGALYGGLSSTLGGGDEHHHGGAAPTSSPYGDHSRTAVTALAASVSWRTEPSASGSTNIHPSASLGASPSSVCQPRVSWPMR